MDISVSKNKYLIELNNGELVDINELVAKLSKMQNLESDLYEANNRIVDYMDIIEERDKIINLMLDTLIGLDSDVEIVRKMASINTKEKKEHLLGIYEKRCKNAKY